MNSKHLRAAWHNTSDSFTSCRETISLQVPMAQTIRLLLLPYDLIFKFTLYDREIQVLDNFAFFGIELKLKELSKLNVQLMIQTPSNIYQASVLF
jgi:hypothetical protein